MNSTESIQPQVSGSNYDNPFNRFPIKRARVKGKDSDRGQLYLSGNFVNPSFIGYKVRAPPNLSLPHEIQILYNNRTQIQSELSGVTIKTSR